MADRLPYDVLLRIFQYIDNIGIDPSVPSHWTSHWLAQNALVCRQWLEPARRALYEDVDLQNYAKLILFYESIRYLKPDNGRLVRSLDLTFFTSDEELLDVVTVRMLEAMPNLRKLDIYVPQYGDIGQLECFGRIEDLRLIFTRDGEDHYRNCEGPLSKALPSKLQNLFINSSLGSFAITDQEETGFESLERLTIACSNPGIDYRRPASTWQLPSMPNLISLDLRHCELQSRQTLACPASLLIRQTARTIRHLKISFGLASSGLVGGILHNLYSLETLECTYESADTDKPSIEGELPASLQYFAFNWRGAAATGIPLMKRLQDPTFLPKLRKCPLIQFTHKAIRSEFAIGERAPDDENIPLLLQERDKALRSLSRRSTGLHCYRIGKDSSTRSCTLLPHFQPDRA